MTARCKVSHPRTSHAAADPRFEFESFIPFTNVVYSFPDHAMRLDFRAEANRTGLAGRAHVRIEEGIFVDSPNLPDAAVLDIVDIETQLLRPKLKRRFGCADPINDRWQLSRQTR